MKLSHELKDQMNEVQQEMSEAKKNECHYKPKEVKRLCKELSFPVWNTEKLVN